MYTHIYENIRIAAVHNSLHHVVIHGKYIYEGVFIDFNSTTRDYLLNYLFLAVLPQKITFSML